MYAVYTSNSIYVPFDDPKYYSVSEDGQGGGALNTDWNGNVAATRPSVAANRAEGTPYIPSVTYYDTPTALKMTLTVDDYLTHTGMSVSSLTASSYAYKPNAASSSVYPPRMNNIMADLKEIITDGYASSYMSSNVDSSGGTSGWTHVRTTMVSTYYYRMVFTSNGKYAVLQAASSGAITMTMWGGDPDSGGISINVTAPSYSFKGAAIKVDGVNTYSHGGTIIISSSPDHLCIMSRDITKTPWEWAGACFSEFVPNYSWLGSKGIPTHVGFLVNSTTFPSTTDLSGYTIYSSKILNPASATSPKTGSSARYSCIIAGGPTTKGQLTAGTGFGNLSVSPWVVDREKITQTTPLKYAGGTGITSSYYLLNPGGTGRVLKPISLTAVESTPIQYSDMCIAYDQMILLPIGIIDVASGTTGIISSKCNIYLVAGYDAGAPPFSAEIPSSFDCENGSSYIRIGLFAIGTD